MRLDDDILEALICYTFDFCLQLLQFLHVLSQPNPHAMSKYKKKKKKKKIRLLWKVEDTILTLLFRQWS
jgi:hypothetical protein